MFVRFRQTRRRLQCSLIETRRVDGKVRHEHIAGLGAVPLEPSVASRIVFWSALHARLASLSNRVDAETQGKVIGQIHARIPMATPDEHRELQRENAEAEARVWSGLHDLHAGKAADAKTLMAAAQRSLAEADAAAADTADRASHAKERLAKIERGEAVAGGLGKPVDLEALLRKAGFRKRDLDDMRRLDVLLAELERRGVDDDYWEALDKHDKAGRRLTARKAEREVLRKHGLRWSDD